MVFVFLFLGYFSDIPLAFSGVGFWVIPIDETIFTLTIPAETRMLTQIFLHEFVIFMTPGDSEVS